MLPRRPYPKLWKELYQLLVAEWRLREMVTLKMTATNDNAANLEYERQTAAEIAEKMIEERMKLAREQSTGLYNRIKAEYDMKVAEASKVYRKGLPLSSAAAASSRPRHVPHQGCHRPVPLPAHHRRRGSHRDG